MECVIDNLYFLDLTPTFFDPWLPCLIYSEDLDRSVLFDSKIRYAHIIPWACWVVFYAQSNQTTQPEHSLQRMRLVGGCEKGFWLIHAHLCPTPKSRAAFHANKKPKNNNISLLNDQSGLTLFDLFTQGAMPQARWDQVHNQRLPLLQPGPGLQRRGCRGYHARAREGHQDRLDEHEPQLGSKLAVKRSVGRAGVVF